MYVVALLSSGGTRTIKKVSEIGLAGTVFLSLAGSIADGMGRRKGLASISVVPLRVSRVCIMMIETP